MLFNKSDRAYNFCLKTLKGFSDSLCRSRQFFQEQKGQTLIEAIVTIAVAFVIIGSIVALVNASNRRATLARQATQASKLAQEGMEIIRNIRDVGHSEAVRVTPCGVASPCPWSELYNNLIGTVPAKLTRPGTNPGECGFTQSWCLDSGSETAMTIFTRTVEISDDDLTDPPGAGICTETSNLTFESIKRVTVTVSWNSPIGAQSRTAVSCISNWR